MGTKPAPPSPTQPSDVPPAENASTPQDIEKSDLKPSHVAEEVEGGFAVGEAPLGGEDPIEARKVLRKIDLRVVPLLIFIYVLCFLDRLNIGNARLWSLEADLGMTGYDYNVAVLAYYPGVMLCELPSNMILSRVQPRYLFAVLVFGFGSGMTVVFAGFATNLASLVVCRFFIGAFEAGVLPGGLYLLSSWYRRHELLTRYAMFMFSTDIAAILSGLLGAGLGSLDGTAGYSGWSWIFFLEGGFTCFMAAIAFFYMPPFPEESTFLQPAEKEWLLRRLHQDSSGGPLDRKMGIKDTFAALRDWKILIAGFLYLTNAFGTNSINIFQPTILATFGWGGIKGNLLTVPVRIASGAASIAVGIWSDRAKRRGIFCIGGYAIAITGCFMTSLVVAYQVRYAGLFLLAIGMYIVQPLVLAWCTNQVVGSTKRGLITAFATITGQIGGILSAVVFPAKDSPQYIPGLATVVAFACAGMITAGGIWFYGVQENKKRAAGKRDHLRALPPAEQELLGERHPDFRFTP